MTHRRHFTIPREKHTNFFEEVTTKDTNHDRLYIAIAITITIAVIVLVLDRGGIIDKLLGV